MADEYIDKVEVGAKIQMMYIRREMDYGGENDFCRGMRKALRIIENMPAADVQPVKHGKWIYVGSIRSWDEIKCSACNSAFSTEDRDLILNWDFCPHCGARMDAESDEPWQSE